MSGKSQQNLVSQDSKATKAATVPQSEPVPTSGFTPAKLPVGLAQPSDILNLQRTVGNRATMRFLQGQPSVNGRRDPKGNASSRPNQNVAKHKPPISQSDVQSGLIQKAGISDQVAGVFTSQLLAQAAALVSQIPDQAYGPLTSLAKAGLQGFIKQLAAVPAMKLVKMGKKVFAALQSPQYLLGYLVGLLKGFFVDGLAGIFILIYDLAKLAINIPLLGVKLAQRLGAPAISALSMEIGQIGQWISQNAPTLAAGLLQGLGGKDGLSGALAQLVAYLLTQAKGAAAKIGGKMASGLLSFFSKSKGAIGRALGEVAGRLSGAVLFEIILAVVTSGGGSAITAVKTGLRAILGLLGKIGRGFLKVVVPLAKILGKAIGALRGWILALANSGPMKALGSKLGELFSKLGNFIKTVVGRLTGSKKAAAATPGGKPPVPADGLPAPASLPPGARTTTEGLPAPASIPRSGAIRYAWNNAQEARAFIETWMVQLAGKVHEFPNHRAFVEYFRSIAGNAREIPVAFFAKGELVFDSTRVNVPISWHLPRKQAQNRRRIGL